MDNLLDVQKIAKINRLAAQEKLLPLVRSFFPNLNIEKIKINQKDYALNSVYGFLVIGNQEYFFKFHAEEGEEKTLKEYYSADTLNKAGFPIMMPVFKSTSVGKQFLIYEKFTNLNFFDFLDILDRQYLKGKNYDSPLLKKALDLEEDFDKKITRVTLLSLKVTSSEKVEKAAINQLFFNRLSRKEGSSRLDIFYKNKKILLPNNIVISFEKLKKLKWIINGIEFEETLEDLISKAKKLLNPKRLKKYPVITAHGDDHNGNKVITGKGLVYYDPAFAGTDQYALLSFIKTTFHDCMAHPLWLYSPNDFKVNLKARITKDSIYVDSDFNWEKIAPLRVRLLGIKLKNIWLPLIKQLKKRNLLEKEYLEFIRSALFVCPFLVYNLADNNRYTPKNSIFALSQAVMVGSKSSDGPFGKFFKKLEGVSI